MERSGIKLTQATAFEWLSQGFALLNTFLLVFKIRTCPQIFQRDIFESISVEKINKPRRHFVVIRELVWGGGRDAVPSAKAVQRLCFWQPHVSISIGPRSPPRGPVRDSHETKGGEQGTISVTRLNGDIQPLGRSDRGIFLIPS